VRSRFWARVCGMSAGRGPRGRALGVALCAMLTGVGLSPVNPAVAHAAATVSAGIDPDTYACNRSGYIDFENFSDATNLSALTFPGVQFSTTNGYTWLVGDFATGSYNGKYPNGSYTSQGSRWAWLGESAGAGRIDFVRGTAANISLLVSASTPVYLEAYSTSGKLLERAGPSSSNVDTGRMDLLSIDRPTADISYVLVHDSGNYFEVDSICTDAQGTSSGTSFTDWHPGDVHVHAAGDSGLTGHQSCQDGISESACAARLVDQTYSVAKKAGLQWMIYTEHAPWLGLYDHVDCLPFPPHKCQTVVLPNVWDGKQARRQYQEIRDAIGTQVRSDQTVRALAGQEVGTAGQVCKANYYNAGHYGVYYTPELVPNGQLDCAEPGDYLKAVADAGAWGGINHPDNGDGASDWHCWYTGDSQPSSFGTHRRCEKGAADYNYGPFRTVEIINDNHLPSLATLNNLDNLLENGTAVGVVGGSDAHTVTRSGLTARQNPGNAGKIGSLGRGRTYAYVPGSIRPTKTYSPVDPGDPVRRALREGRTIASTGQLAIPSIGGAAPGSSVTLTGTSALLRVDWRRSDGAPDDIVVVTGSRSGCPKGRTSCAQTQDVVPSATDRDRGWLEVAISTAGIGASGYVRTEAMYRLVNASNRRYRGAKEYAYGSFSSPIYLTSARQPFAAQVPAGGAGVVTGTISGAPAAIDNASIELCSPSNQCSVHNTDASGTINIVTPPGSYRELVFPGAGADTYPPVERTLSVPNGGSVDGSMAFTHDIGVPDGTVLTGAVNGPDNVPVVWTGSTTALQTTACPGGSGSGVVTRNGSTVASFLLTSARSGVYVGSLPALAVEGAYRVQLMVDCSGETETSFDLYAVVPSVVRDTHGRPIPGASVTLLQSDTAAGPFLPVPDASATLSPATRADPSSTDSAGRFGWDMQAGLYRVAATAAGCTSPADRGVSTVQSASFVISGGPPPSLALTLNCDRPATHTLTIRPTTTDDTPVTFVYDVACNVNGITQRYPTVSVRAGTAAVVVGAVADGASCTVTQKAQPPYRALEGNSYTLAITDDTEFRFTNSTAPPASVQIYVASLPLQKLFASVVCGAANLGTFEIPTGAPSVAVPHSVSDGTSCTADFRLTPTGPVIATTSAIAAAPETEIAADIETQADASPPTCVVSAVRVGPPKQQDVTVRDTETGLKAIINVHVTNGTVSIPQFIPGTIAPVVVTASKTDQTLRTTWEFDVEDMAGNRKHCA
jgi:hypothetical protein